MTVLCAVHYAGAIPSPSLGPGDTSAAPTDFATGLSLFLVWVLTKAFIVAIPLYTVMRIAVRHSQNEAWESMYRAADIQEGAVPAAGRHLVLAVRAPQPAQVAAAVAEAGSNRAAQNAARPLPGAARLVGVV